LRKSVLPLRARKNPKEQQKSGSQESGYRLTFDRKVGVI
jgi:hypothetical protein